MFFCGAAWQAACRLATDTRGDCQSPRRMPSCPTEIVMKTMLTEALLRILLHWLVHFQPLLPLLGDKKVHPHVVEIFARGNLRSMVGAERDVKYGESLEISLRLVGANGDVVVL